MKDAILSCASGAALVFALTTMLALAIFRGESTDG